MRQLLFHPKFEYVCDLLTDALCIGSLVGIWPRFVEPNYLEVNHLNLPLLPKGRPPLKILHLTDLHFSRYTPQHLSKKILRESEKFQPDLICFTGDFICYSQVYGARRLKNFLENLKAPLGKFAILGNHDYEAYLTFSKKGVAILKKRLPFLFRALTKIMLPGNNIENLQELPKNLLPQPQLSKILKDSNFRVLNNEHTVIDAAGYPLNLVGLGDHWAQQDLPEKAYENYHPEHPGLVLCHNPDSFDKLKDFPADLVLCGHTHGGQMNLPLLVSKTASIKNKDFLRGLKNKDNKHIYINRGIGAPYPARLFARPEIALITLTEES